MKWCNSSLSDTSWGD